MLQIPQSLFIERTDIIMARKSRKHIEKNTVSTRPLTLRVAAYLRISEAKGLPPESSENQLKIIEEFLACRPDMTLAATYTDVNVSGRSFQREGFQEMIRAIESGKIDCVIVEDLSRLGRNMIETGYYIKKHFPIHGVRLISVTDQVETVDGISNLDERNPINIPLLNLCNETVSNEISRSTETVLNTYARDGKYIAPRAPYGYRKSPDDCHRLLIDPEAAAIVRKIFAMAQEGSTITEIVRRLNQEGILPPSLYARQNRLIGKYQDSDGYWNAKTVKNILTNYTYTGNLVQGKNRVSAINTHEPIITAEIFDAVQERFSTIENCRKVEESVNPLRGKVICEHCGGKMQRKRGSGRADWFFFTCITRNRRGAEYCDGAYIRESDIMLAIRQEIRAMQPQCLVSIAQCDKRITEITEKLHYLIDKENIQLAKRQEAYERYITGRYTTQEYKEAVNKFPLSTLQINQLQVELERIKKIKKISHTRISALCCQNVFESLLKEQLLQVVISGGVISKVVFVFPTGI